MEDKEYKTPEELIEFVLKECSDMDYKLEEWRIAAWSSISGMKDGEFRTVVREFRGKKAIRLNIFKNFDMEKIYYLNKLLLEYFNVYIHHLGIYDEFADIKNGYLDKMTVKELGLPMNYKVVPKLPLTLLKIKRRGSGNLISISKHLYGYRVSDEMNKHNGTIYQTKKLALKAIETGKFTL